MANVDDYEVLDWVGGGCFGSVNRVRRKRDGAVVCWKRVQYGGFSEAEKRAVVAEVNCLRELHSPFVVRFLDRVVDRKATAIYIVMEYCEGGDLAQVLEGLRKKSTGDPQRFLAEPKVID
jgi:NIMA (never in mitosis gene a)-related kinase